MHMAALRRTDRLIDRLPAVRGDLRADVPLARFTWFRAGGPAEALFVPADGVDAMTAALEEVQKGEVRQRLRAAGLAHAAGFSWEKTARGVREALEGVWAGR